MKLKEIWKNTLDESAKIHAEFCASEENMAQCERFSQVLTETLSSGNKIMACGNGGSHCDAMHFSEEFTGRFKANRRPLPAMALGEASHTTCVSNDFGFEYIFSRQVEAFGRQGDLLVAISTSGNSQNVIRAVEAAKAAGVKTVGLLGKGGGKLKEMVDVPIVVPANDSGRVQEMHIKLIHTVIETAERELFPENYTN